MQKNCKYYYSNITNGNQNVGKNNDKLEKGTQFLKTLPSSNHIFNALRHCSCFFYITGSTGESKSSDGSRRSSEGSLDKGEFSSHAYILSSYNAIWTINLLI